MFYTAIETRGVSESKVQKWKSHMAVSDVQEPFLNVVLTDTASFFYNDFLDLEKWRELRTEICTSAAISVIHQAASEGYITR